jgi:hypothetical protein
MFRRETLSYTPSGYNEIFQVVLGLLIPSLFIIAILQARHFNCNSMKLGQELVSHLPNGCYGWYHREMSLCILLSSMINSLLSHIETSTIRLDKTASSYTRHVSHNSSTCSHTHDLHLRHHHPSGVSTFSTSHSIPVNTALHLVDVHPRKTPHAWSYTNSVFRWNYTLNRKMSSKATTP